MEETKIILNKLYKKTFQRYTWQRELGNFRLAGEINRRWKVANRKLLLRYAVSTTHLPSLYFFTVVLKFLKQQEVQIKQKIIMDNHRITNKALFKRRIKRLRFSYKDFGITRSEFTAIDSKDPDLDKIRLFRDTTSIDFYDRIYKIRFNRLPPYRADPNEFPLRIGFEHKKGIWRREFPADECDHFTEYWMAEYGFFNSSVNLLKGYKKNFFNLNRDDFSTYTWKDFIPGRKFLNIHDGYIDHWFPPETCGRTYDHYWKDRAWSAAYDDRWGEEEWKPELGPEFEWDSLRYKTFVTKVYFFFFKPKVYYSVFFLIIYIFVFEDIFVDIDLYIKENILTEPKHSTLRQIPMPDSFRNWDGHIVPKNIRDWWELHKPRDVYLRPGASPVNVKKQ